MLVGRSPKYLDFFSVIPSPISGQIDLYQYRGLNHQGVRPMLDCGFDDENEHASFVSYQVFTVEK